MNLFQPINFAPATGGGGSSYEKVNTFADLPSASSNADVIYFVRQTTGTWILGTEKKSGHYYSNGTTWTYAPNIDKTLSLKVGAVLIDNAPEVEFVAGSNITLSADAAAKTVTVNASGVTSYNDLSDKPTIPTQYTDEMAVSANSSALSNKVDKADGSRLITSAESTLLGNTSGTNTGDETKERIIDKLGYTPLAPNGSGANLTNLCNKINHLNLASNIKAYTGSALALSAGVYTKMPFTSKAYDSLSEFNASTSKLTPTFSQTALLQFALGFTTSSTLAVCVYKDGSATDVFGLSGSQFTSSLIYSFQTGYYYEFYIYSATANSMYSGGNVSILTLGVTT